METFNNLESQVQSYARSFPALFNKAQGAHIFDTEGNRWIDFLAGAGTLNYGHNNPILKAKLIEYIQNDGITHGLDMHTQAKADFLNAFNDIILTPRGLDYVCQFTGPTGTNAVEAAMKLARKITNRTNIISFTNGFHGVTVGAIAATGNAFLRNGAGMQLQGVTSLPYDGYLDEQFDTTELIEKLIIDSSSGLDLPAACLVETVQGEGGLNYASNTWLRNLEAVCRRHDILLIIDDIQAGCGRTGTFFSFEPAGIKPDMVTLSKSLSGYGLPFALVLIRPDHDVWEPGEHNGTFRGNNHAFVTATAAINAYWQDDAFTRSIEEKSAIIQQRMERIVKKAGPSFISIKGRGMMKGLSFSDPKVTRAVAKTCFNNGLIIETCGPESEVLKCLCPLIIDKKDLNAGFDIIETSIQTVLNKYPLSSGQAS